MNPPNVVPVIRPSSHSTNRMIAMVWSIAVPPPENGPEAGAAGTLPASFDAGTTS
jgi:hypothetical protein